MPQPANWDSYARDAQVDDKSSTLNLYRRLLQLRQDHALGTGSLNWVEGTEDDVLAFANGNVLVVANYAQTPLPLPAEAQAATELVRSQELDSAEAGMIPGETTIWFQLD